MDDRDTSNVEGHPQPSGMSVSFGQQQDLAGLSTSMPMTYQPPRPPLDAFGPRPTLDMDSIKSWYNRNDGPWNPHLAMSGEEDSTRNNLRFHPLGVPLNYRASLASECGTVPDSGYGSYNPKQSIANGSVCEEILDRSLETQSLVHGIGELNFQFSPGGIKPGFTLGQPWNHPQPHNTDRQIPVEPAFYCHTCGKALKTASENKKHQQRHTKPHKCDIEGCTRAEGFSTTNDLERHKRSVHPDADAGGNRYKCQIGPCQHKTKIWPRADNFKAHMKRVHHQEIDDEGLQRCIYKPSSPAGEHNDGPKDGAFSDITEYPMVPSGQSGSPQVGWEASQHSVMALPTADEPGRHLSQFPVEQALPLPGQPINYPGHRVTGLDPDPENSQDHNPLYLEPARQPTSSQSDWSSGQESVANSNQSERIDAESVADTSEEIDTSPNASLMSSDHLIMPSDSLFQPQPRVRELSLDETKITDASESHTVGEEIVSDNFDPLEDRTTHRGSFPFDLSDQAGLKRFLDSLHTDGRLKELGFKKEESESKDTKQDDAMSSTREHSHACSKCDKTFMRKCELRKHEKRHDKPYGCTFQGCNKRFGSKNDWKRHENSQHFMLEMWKCDERHNEKPSEFCAKVCHRREVFSKHLSSHHSIKDPKKIEYKVESCRVGRNCEARFWCGFCETIVEIKHKGLQAWAERFDHIDNHFSGKNSQTQMDISDWKNIDPAHPRPPSDIDDCCDSRPHSRAPTPAAHASRPSTSAPVGTGPRAPRSTKSKRKRDDDEVKSNKKARHAPTTVAGFICCQCNELISPLSQQCDDIACQHRMCKYCTAV